MSQKQDTAFDADGTVEFAIGPDEMSDGELVAGWTVTENSFPSDARGRLFTDGSLVLRVAQHQTLFDLNSADLTVGTIALFQGSGGRNPNLTVEVVGAAEAARALQAWCSSR